MLTMEQRDMIFDSTVSDAKLASALKGVTVTAFDVIGAERLFRVKGGRSVYELAHYDDSRGGNNVRFDRMVADTRGLRVINCYVDQDAEIEFATQDQYTTKPPKRKKR